MRIIKNGVIGKPTGRSVVADTGAKVMSKLRQIYNGHVITENHGAVVFDKSKIEYIKNNLVEGLPFYIASLQKAKCSRESFGARATDDPDIFNAVSDSVFIQSAKSCREGVNLSSADHLYLFGIDYSALVICRVEREPVFLAGIEKIKSIIFLRKRESSQKFIR